MHKPNRDAIAQRGTPIPTQCFALQTQWFCYGNTVILLRKHTTFPPLVLLALPMHIQAYHDPINDPHYQPSPRPQPRRCCLCCRLYCRVLLQCRSFSVRHLVVTLNALNLF